MGFREDLYVIIGILQKGRWILWYVAVSSGSRTVWNTPAQKMVSPTKMDVDSILSIEHILFITSLYYAVQQMQFTLKKEVKKKKQRNNIALWSDYEQFNDGEFFVDNI